ncbi:hypothetical protein QYE76_053923 [Lolium multiflorum]|uniref:Transposon protein n=1 Tax=Lolium multiflorum TaxID=4521 RepID=A0AAD8SXB5_LOLMU|nr:hypothetical protein QYE76_053923 [Lolium multiflorum]
MVRNNMTLIRCPCRKCGLRQWIDPDSGQLEEHLLRRGFMLGFNEEPAANVGHEEEADIGREDEESPEHGVHHEEGEGDEGDDDAGGDGGGDAESKQTPLTSALRDPHVQELLLKDTGNAKPEAKLAQMEVDGMTPLYPGCRPEDTRLSVTLECLEMKAEHKWTDNSFSDNMKSWHARLPKDNTLPTSIDEAKKVVCPLDLPHVKYHACINDCALFRNEYKDRTTCPVCGQGRYKRGNKKVPLKVVWYFPITPRLQRYFVDPKEAKLMQWHAEREKPADDPEKGKILTHPADASQWNALDIEFADEFGSEPRNIRLGMSTDGLNPFGNQSSTHSTWPVFVWPYNLPPGCAQSSVQDYPGYAYVSCQVNHGFKACVKCMDKTPHLQLPKPPGSCKTVFQGTRMWLRFDHPWRKRKDLFNGEEELGRAPRPRSGEEISELLENWEECPAPGKKRPRESPLLGVWKARSVFWDLPYWKVLHTPHSLDVMHITKNVTESLLGTLMNMPERTKDGPKARTDLKLLGLKKELQYPTDSDDDDDDEQTETTQGHHKRAKKNEVVVLKPACFTLSEEELERFFECLLGVKVPHGYSGKISRYLDVAKKRFSGMKSHDCHVLMTQILPVAMRGIMDDHVRETLFGLCNFFDVISRKSIGVKQLNRLQEEIVEILCELEIYFPPAFFDIMVHLLVHVVDDIIHLGPTFLHNMMPFERLNGVIKGFVRNRARPDGSIAKGFLTYECISFCQNYLSTENEDVGLPTRKHVGRLAGFGHREGYRAMHVGIAGRHADFDRAHRVALQHIELVSPWVDKHKSLIEQKFIDLGRPRKTGDVTKEHNSTFTGWFKKRLLESPAPMPSTEEQKLIFSLSQGPGHNVRTYQSLMSRKDSTEGSRRFGNSTTLAKADLPEAESSSQGSTEPWDTPFNRALNILKERPVSKPPTSAGRVCGFGTSMKFREYYKEESSKKRRRSAMSEEDKAEVEELRKKVSMLEEKQANSMDKDEVDKLFEKKLRDFLPPQVIEGIAAWNAAGQVGSIKVPSAGASNSIFNASPSPDLVTPPPTIAAGQPMELDEPVPPADPAEATKAQPAAVVLHNAPEPQKIDRPAATVSTLAQLNAITKDTPCVLLHCAPGGELKDVATGMIIQPKSTTLHTVAMDANVLKVTLGRVLPGCEDMDPPIQPEGADEHLTLENCHGYTMVWPKTQIRLGGRSTGASSIIRQPIVRPPARRAAPPVVTATTSRHKKLLGESLPQPPPAEPKGKAAAPLSPIPSPNEDDIDDDGPVDVDAYLNTGADIDDLYMAGADEEAYRARDEPAGPPKATKQRLVFRGFSQETPPAADTQEPTAANIFSPNTLIKKVNEQFEASGAVAPKKPRKRPSKNKEKSASQPPPTIRHRDSMVPPSKDGLTRMHEAGKPILGPELQHLASGDMLPLQDSILVLESILLKDKDPNYPVFTVRVPRDVGFVTDAPADIFFIAYEDIFKLFHARRLDYNLVRLFALNLAMKIKRESTPDVAIADPYYMRESQLNLSAVRVRASLYLQKCFLDNKRKDNILLAYFPEDTHCVLISIAPKFSLATYFDSGSAKKKNYARIRGVLDDALEGYFKKGGAFKEKAECFRDDGKHKFKHVFEFPCVKQPENSTLDAFYVMHHLKGFVRDSQNLRLPSALRGWAEKLARINDDDLREDFQDTRVKLSHIIIQDVTTGGGPLHQGRALCKRDIEHRLKAQGDTRTWITKDLYKPFPEPCEP